MKNKKFVKIGVAVFLLLVGGILIAFFPRQNESPVPQPQENKTPVRPPTQPTPKPVVQTPVKSTNQTAVRSSEEAFKAGIVYPSLLSLAFCSSGSIILGHYVLPDTHAVAQFFIGFFCAHIGWCGFRGYRAMATSSQSDAT